MQKAGYDMEITETTEEYLETIYKLQKKDGRARTKDLVRLLNVVPGSVTNTIERLEREGYITHEPYKGVKLTEKGEKLALQVVRRHRLSERLLTDILHIEWDKVHDAACRLEHTFTIDLAKKIEKVLGHPKMCPHGNPIPTELGEIIEEKTEPLINLKSGESAVIAKIAEEENGVLKYLATVGIKPGVRIEVLKKSTGNKVIIKLGNKSHELSKRIASIIEVRRGK